MNHSFNFKTALLAASLLLIPAAHAANIAKADYDLGKTRISADYKADKAACGSMAGNAKDICVQEAKAREKVAKAELKSSYTGTPADHTKVKIAKAESAYAVAKEKCDDMAGNDKAVCRKEAKAIEVTALTDARMAKKIGEVRKDGAQDKVDADYKVAAEKCDALSGDSRTSCMNSAKAKFGKT